ncbi:uncharacterized protein LOC132315716 isoform X2 [Cornus florida]|uniref:uncharacterized protein LOC132315716 isoform X2 n=1 Tax=Cornus florida TaxID=4283 RepID=UPI0028A1D155|nr:uncharacterized protein LOC132315716 isoform X2 [Cornus florida]
MGLHGFSCDNWRVLQTESFEFMPIIPALAGCINSITSLVDSVLVPSVVGIVSTVGQITIYLIYNNHAQNWNWLNLPLLTGERMQRMTGRGEMRMQRMSERGEMRMQRMTER